MQIYSIDMLVQTCQTHFPNCLSWAHPPLILETFNGLDCILASTRGPKSMPQQDRHTDSKSPTLHHPRIENIFKLNQTEKPVSSACFFLTSVIDF